MHKLSEIGSNRFSVQSPTQEITTNKFSDSQNRVTQVPSNYDMMRKKHSQVKRDLKRKVLMPNKKAQQEIERQLCKDSKFATIAEYLMDETRKLILRETKSKGCYDEVAEARRKRNKEEQKKRIDARKRQEESRLEALKKKGINLK